MIEIDGLAISPHPTERFTSVRFIDASWLDASFERNGELARVYVDPNEWSLRTFENIVPLDRMPVDVGLVDRVDVGPGIDRFTLVGGESLLRLDELPFYITPTNAVSRGGLRYIFHHARLAEQLTHALRDVMPAEFSHVNPVFRCNRFEPGDEPFHRHVDTPYYDAARNHVSRYTLIVYLTGGRGEPALQIEDIALADIAPMTCVVFHQLYEHAGRAFVDGRKVFLRTELIFEDATVKHAPRIAQLFSKAVYLTGESIRAPELARDADRAYNRVAAAHWSGQIDDSTPLVHKRFRGTHWLANGFDFWFRKDVPLLECAALTLLDYFNCKLGNEPFRTLCSSEVVRDRELVAQFSYESSVGELDLALLFPEPESNLSCCPQHQGDTYDPTRSHDVVELYAAAQHFARTRIASAPISLLGQEVFLDPSHFVVHGNQIHVLSAQRLAPVNFASCWNCESRPPDYVEVDVTVRTLQPLLPPILWEDTGTTRHLTFDFFRNSWVSDRTLDVPVPRISLAEGNNEWLAAARNAEPDEKAPKLKHAPWWGYYAGESLLMRDLFRGR